MTMGQGGIFGNPNAFNGFSSPFDKFKRDKNYNPLLSMTPNIDGTQIGMPQIIQQAAQEMPDTPAPKKDGGLAWKILGAIGDGLAVYGGAQPTYMPTMLALQDKIDEERKWQAQLQQQAELARIKAADPGEDSFTRAMDAAGIPRGSQEYIAMARKRAEMLTNPVQLVDDGYGGKIAVRPNAGEDTTSVAISDWEQAKPLDAAMPKSASQTISPSEYQRAQKAMGPQAAAKWMIANNIQVIGN